MPKRKNTATLNSKRAVMAFREMVDCRREFCPDNQFFRAIEFWEWLAKDNEYTKIKTFLSEGSEKLKQASVVALEERVTLIISDEMINAARRGNGFVNTILAHELSHFALGHHESTANLRNFQLGLNGDVRVVRPDSVEELEADYASVFFLCGIALLEKDADPVDLARRAFADVSLVKKAINICRVPAFLEELDRQKRAVIGTVVL